MNNFSCFLVAVLALATGWLSANFRLLGASVCFQKSIDPANQFVSPDKESDPQDLLPPIRRW